MKFSSVFLLTKLSQSIDTFSGGPTFDVTYDQTANKLKYTVNVPTNMYLALAYGSGMSGTDAVIFQGKDSGLVQDIYAQGYYTPTVDNS